MDQFLGMANHEMKSPLTALSANLQLASRRLRRLAHMGAHAAAGQASGQAEQIEGQVGGLLDAAHISHETESVLEMLARAQSAARRMTRLVNELLDVSRIQTGRLETRPEPCDLLALTRTVIAEQIHAQPGRADQPSRDIALEATCEQAPIIADPDRISEVIDNYLSNAIKYSPPATPITITLACEEAVARLSVRNAGPGISPEAQARIWNVFERLDSGPPQPTEGVNLGLGLHICKTIIALHDGEVGVESAPSAGATFWFTLPLAPGQL
jgi:signal transduction histidine kinase